jgi:hypothetical protein
MKKFAALVGGLALVGAAGAQAQTLTVSATLNPGGKNVNCVMWMTNTANQMVHTFATWQRGSSSGRSNDYPNWWACSGTTTGATTGIDAITSATYSATANVSGVWHCNGSTSAVVPSGTYKFWIEAVQFSGHTDNYVVGSIMIDNTAKTKSTVDSGSVNGSTVISSVSAVYAPGTSAAEQVTIPKSHQPTGLAFTAPANFNGGSVAASLISANGRQVWSSTHSVAAGGSLSLRSDNIRPAMGFTGVGTLVADFNGQRMSYRFVVSK